MISQRLSTCTTWDKVLFLQISQCSLTWTAWKWRGISSPSWKDHRRSESFPTHEEGACSDQRRAGYLHVCGSPGRCAWIPNKQLPCMRKRCRRLAVGKLRGNPAEDSRPPCLSGGKLVDGGPLMSYDSIRSRHGVSWQWSERRKPGLTSLNCQSGWSSDPLLWLPAAPALRAPSTGSWSLDHWVFGNRAVKTSSQ